MPGAIWGRVQEESQRDGEERVKKTAGHWYGLERLIGQSAFE